MRKFLLLLGCVSLAGCLGGDTTGVNGTPSDPTTESFAPALGVNISQMTKVAVGSEFVYYKDLAVGTGTLLSSPVTVVITYAGYLTNGALFDGAQGVAIPLAGSVPGFQTGMLGMKEGGERLIVIPSDLGYGSTQVSRIPPNSTLVFDVRLEQIP
ncbi:MAG TPA: FKBP-type peptidyl-prolyl cis-trans isomerase [Gemmatimonadaceae bacterium]|nr:FKBP-type peptidyl-prolyl cis-trans isomerase [Gemmatimonadaceae bacterium]